ncbi:hypothetical protein DFP72DRAFT_991577 [Ephemerocybe angulata]|uniref:Uncharacterized protein n=1 Tax=Ephemerocybe angulata TaxID=980116 RepID=A0A8H6HP90_9AGAR|nr:hypothetical protein DFP72DRAFT_991577 [Tulosesus angulatus]
MHLPRSVFSQRQLDLFLWLLKANDMNDVPSVDTMDSITSRLQDLCGIRTMPHDGPLGHRFYMNNIGDIISQEMANPKVRRHLHFYPEDAGPKVAHAYQANRWLHELPDDMTTPMARVGTQDFYIYELAMLKSGRCCVPVRWFMAPAQEGNGQELFAKAWPMEMYSDDDGRAWRVVKDTKYTIPATQLIRSFPVLRMDIKNGLYDLPLPELIRDFYDPALEPDDQHQRWRFTNPVIGNRWRHRAKNHRVVSFPVWLYCDDTSGNTSKKWNCHNSYLFTPAGLLRSEIHKEYNIHFICTSNIAPPLEMMDGVAAQFEHLQEHGVWAWDCEAQEPILVFPVVLALLGDNPMQSEFACHIGLRGRMFCRSCWVEGFKGKRKRKGDDGDISDDSGYEPDEEDDANEGDDDDSGSGSDTGSQNSGVSVTASGLADTEAFSRLKSFVKPGTPRNAEQTKKMLSQFFESACQPGNMTSIKKSRTTTGVKDTFQLHFLNKLFDVTKGKRAEHTKQAALDAAKAALPEQGKNPNKLISPVFRFKGLDPHTDTPVEILHVDAIHNQLKNKKPKKDLLATRLSCLDVSGLGLSPLPGQTLVQYAGSLVGRDFRAIAQVAPFVLYDMVTPECFETWKCLSKLVPLIWQPEIEDIDSFVKTLEQEIQNFLVTTAKWTSRWFNKPKFHILVHLPDHIRRFGPAILFATEGFESFNAIIRAKSVHSNRQAPSRDIARAFGQASRVRHLVSGGLFQKQLGEASTDIDACDKCRAFSFDVGTWTCAGPGPRNLLRQKSTITSYLAKCIRTPGNPRTFNDSFILENGDRCSPGLQATGGESMTVGEVNEIVISDSAMLSSPPSAVLLQVASTNRAARPYDMPYIDLLPQWTLVTPSRIRCTVNAQHPCAVAGCKDTGTRAVRQERIATNISKKAIEHLPHIGPDHNPVLNLAQMRDARFLQAFRLPPPLLPVDETLLASPKRTTKAKKPVPSATVSTPANTRRVTELLRGRGGPS